MKGSVVTREQKIKQKKERFWFWVLLVEFTQKSTKDFASFFFFLFFFFCCICSISPSSPVPLYPSPFDPCFSI